MAGNNVKISSDLIQQYVNITGSDKESALHLLEAFDGDLERAVNMYLEGGVPPSTNQTASNAASSSSKKKKTNEINRDNNPAENNSGSSTNNTEQSTSSAG